MRRKVVIVNAYGASGSAAARLGARLADYDRVEVSIENVDSVVNDQTAGVIFTSASGPVARKSSGKVSNLNGFRSRRGAIDVGIRLRRAHPTVPIGVYATGLSASDAADAKAAAVTIDVQLDVLLARLGLTSAAPPGAARPV